MAKIKIIRYKCDICGMEYEDEKSVTTEKVPCYGGESSQYNSTADVDMCKACSDKIRKVIYDNFAEINDYYGLNIIVK